MSNYSQQTNSPTNRLKFQRQKGQVISLKTSFGFIRVVGRKNEVFFHLSKVLDQREPISVGDEVDFLLETDKNSREERFCALDIRRLPKGSVIFEELLKEEGRKRAVVLKELEYARNGREPFGGIVRVESDGEKLPFSGRDTNYYPVKLLEGDKVDVSVYKDKITKKRGATQITLVEPSLEKRERGIVISVYNNSYGFIKCAEREENKLFFHFSERLDTRYIPREDHGVEFNVIRDINGKICASRILYVDPQNVHFFKILPTCFKGQIRNGLNLFKNRPNNADLYSGGIIAFKVTVVDKQVEELLPFDSAGVIDFEPSMKFLPGDKVLFQVAIHKPSGKRSASNVQLTFKAKQKTERGIICFVKESEFGFIQRPKTQKNIYFKISEGAKYENGESVEFAVVSQPSLPAFASKGECFADDVKKLPRGTVKFFEDSKEFFNGVVLSSQTTQTPRNNEEEIFDGTLGFCEENSKNAKTIPFLWRLTANPNIQLRKGDIVSFRRRIDLRFDNITSAIDVELVKSESASKRLEGIVSSVREDYGFLISLDHPNSIFFHNSQLPKSARKSVQEGDEFSYEVLKENSENEREKAVRLINLPKNTVQLDDVDDTLYIGRIEETGYSYVLNKGLQGTGKGSLDYCNNEIYNKMVLNLNLDTVVNEKNNREIANNISSLPFQASDVPDGARILVKGDFVRFNVASEKATGKLHAKNIAILSKLGRVLSTGDNMNTGELQDLQSKEFFEFESGPKSFDEGKVVIFDVIPRKRKEWTDSFRREAFNLRERDYLVIEKGLFEGYVKEIEPIGGRLKDPLIAEERKREENCELKVGGERNGIPLEAKNDSFAIDFLSGDNEENKFVKSAPEQHEFLDFKLSLID